MGIHPGCNCGVHKKKTQLTRSFRGGQRYEGPDSSRSRPGYIRREKISSGERREPFHSLFGVRSERRHAGRRGVKKED